MELAKLFKQKEEQLNE